MKINIKNRLKSICATLFISLFLSCNNGIEELEKRNSFLSSLANLGNDFLSVFTSFFDVIAIFLVIKVCTKKQYMEIISLLTFFGSCVRLVLLSK
ncbi:hypothetical protein [Borrelia coriaceae]|uniref:Variable outer membrane protein n=1 Tax=Borrelia coriaceae ATCC 43381 TaxID=1408429 RepID=W5SZ58_9SPIR|nr:hypothetical protein [Borrelia coriaceae]AHH11963.1 Variable outer membrane protein [Borrelia coriaceae ATCC 43381]